MDSANVRWPNSLWAAVTPIGSELPELVGAAEADVIVVGGGFTGLSTALHLREAGVDVAVVEAMEPGWGASGRNNGQVIPTLSRPDPEDIVAKHGAAGERFVTLLRDCASTLFDVARRYQIEAEQEQAGWVQPVHSPGRIKIAERRVQQWSKFGAPVELLSRDEVRKMLGSEAWFGGFWNKTGGHINPLALARGLARVVLEQGCRIYARSPAVSFERRNDRWIVKTEKGEISGRALVMATNVYTGEFSKSLLPDIAHEVMPILSWQMATQPLSEEARKTVIPGRQAMSDTHGELYFARYDARNRLVTGGAGRLWLDRLQRSRGRAFDRARRRAVQSRAGCSGKRSRAAVLGSCADRRAWIAAPARTADVDGLPAARRAGNRLSFIPRAALQKRRRESNPAALAYKDAAAGRRHRRPALAPPLRRPSSPRRGRRFARLP